MTEFYVGYLPKVPSGIARRMKVVIVVLFATVITCAIGFAAVQRTYSQSFFESGKERTFEGVIETSPYPTLLSPQDAANSSTLRYLLVAKGKHGAGSPVATYVGKTVRLRGTLIYRDDQKMIVLSPVQSRRSMTHSTIKCHQKAWAKLILLARLLIASATSAT